MCVFILLTHLVKAFLLAHSHILSMHVCHYNKTIQTKGMQCAPRSVFVIHVLQPSSRSDHFRDAGDLGCGLIWPGILSEKQAQGEHRALAIRILMTWAP